MEISHRIVNKFTSEIRSCKCLHDANKALDLDLTNWMKIHELRLYNNEGYQFYKVSFHKT